MEKVFKENTKIFVPTTESKTPKGVEQLDFPKFRRSILQQDNIHLMRTLNSTTLIESRRIGKTTSAADYFYQFHIMEGSLMKRNGLSILAHPQAQELYSRFYEGALLQPFGNKEGLEGGGLDDVYIRLPSRYMKYLFIEGDHNKGINQIGEADFDWFFKPYNKKGDTLVVIPYSEDYPYVKLFRENIGNNVSAKAAEGICKGTLFNGSLIELVSANYNFDKYVSGNAVDFLWGEELGTWARNYISKVAIQAVLQRKGKIINTLTPDKKNPDPSQHWTYTDIVEPVISHKNTTHKIIHGLNIYISSNDTETPTINAEGRTILELVSRTIGVVIGRLSECFPYSHDNQAYFSSVLSSLNEVVTPIWQKNSEGELARSESGSFICERLIYTGEKRPGSIDMIDWYREYEMSFEGRGTTLCFPSFGEHNILSSEYKEYFSKFNTIIGFDKGMSLVDEMEQYRIQKDGSITIFVYIAKVGDNQWVVFDEHLANYDYLPIGQKMLTEIRQKRPTVYDSVLNNTISKMGSTKNNDIYQIGIHTPELAKDYRAGIYHRCLIPSHKREKIIKIREFNNMFEVRQNLINPVKHPLNKEEDGARLYILEHCKEVITFFRKQKWKVDKEGHLMMSKGDRVPDDTGDDAFDALTYPIDLYNIGIQANTKKRYNTIIEEIWKDSRLSATNNIYNNFNQNLPSYTVSAFGSRNSNVW